MRRDRSRVLVLRGDAGVGKTALLEYLVAQASGCRIARASGVESEMASARAHPLAALFWLSLVPFVTRWMGEQGFARWPTVLYGVILVLAGFAYWLLEQAIVREEGAGSMLATAVGNDRKALFSVVLYCVAIPLALWRPVIAVLLYALGSLVWLVPDRRIERAVTRGHSA